MPAGKQAQTQWDFGELFPPQPPRRVLSVSELTAQIRRLLETQVGQVWVSGEITNFRLQSSGHIYFTLKDAGAQLACVLFRGQPVARREWLQDGQKVVLAGEITVYEPRGQYQLRVTAVEWQGLGALQLAFERLKQKLQAEGWFAPERKRPLPRFPRCVGLVTSPTGAALRDVLHVVQRRNPALQFLLAPCRVQGQGAAEEIAAAIRLLNEFHASGPAGHPPLDLILLTRGGGSLEDLWAFNEEIVARAIFQSALPVVSAVGHEIDFTISDFVADVRAATPSAAAELITADVFASRQFVAQAPELLGRWVRQQCGRLAGNCASLAGRLQRAAPRRRLDASSQRLDELHAGLQRGVRQGTRERQRSWQHLAQRLVQVRPALHIRQCRETVRQTRRALSEAVQRALRDWRHRCATARARLRLLGPEQVLGRGYSLTTDAATGQILRDARTVRPAQLLRTRLEHGVVFSRAERTE